MSVLIWSRRAGLAVAGGLVVLACLPGGVNAAPAADPEAGRPAAWSGAAAVKGVHYTIDSRPPLTPFPEFFYAAAPDGESTFDSGGTSEARAASFWPGIGGSGLPSVICLAGFPCPAGFPPPYPFSAAAAYPSKTDARAPASGPADNCFSVGDVHAHADRTYVESVAGVTNAGSPVATVKDIRATTRQEFIKGELVVHAESVLRGINLGGVVQIDQVRAVSTGRGNGRKSPSDKSSVTVSGATAAGQEVAIDNRGIRVVGQGDSGAAIAAANTALEQALSAAGIVDVKLIGVTRVREGRSLSVKANGILVTFRHIVTGAPVPPAPPGFPIAPPNPNRTYFGTVTLGGAGTITYADQFAFGNPAGGPTVTGPGPVVNPGNTGNVPLPPSGPSITPVDNPVPSAPITDPVPQAGAPQARRTVFAGFSELTRDRLLLLYVAGLLATIVSVVGRFSRTPARLPRAQAR